MNTFPNSALSATQPQYIVVKSNFNTLQVDANLEPEQLEQYNHQKIEETYDGSTALQFEVLSDEFAIESNDECSNSAATCFPTNRTPAQWSRDTIYYLIGTYKRLARDEASGRTNFGTTVIWTEVSRKLMRRGFTYTPEQCRTKWSLLKKLYQHIRNETQLQKFEFIEAIHDYYKNPKIERLLEQTRKNMEVLRRPKKSRGKSKSSIVEAEIKSNADNFTYTFDPDECETTSMSQNFDDSNKNTSHLYTDAQQDDTESVSFKVEIETNTCETQPAVSHEDQEALDENQEENAFDHARLTPVDQHSHFIEEFKKIIESQEQRRDERHKEKLRIFCDYNERLLVQQESAIMLYKQLMERLIENL